MNENSKEPVVEQALDNIESNVSDENMVIESPSTSKKKISPDLIRNQNNSDTIDYLSDSIFENTKEVSIDEQVDFIIDAIRSNMKGKKNEWKF